MISVSVFFTDGECIAYPQVKEVLRPGHGTIDYVIVREQRQIIIPAAVVKRIEVDMLP